MTRKRTFTLVISLLLLVAVSLACGGSDGGGGTTDDGPLLEDDFSSESSGWEVGDYDGGSVGYTGDGAYFVRTAEDGGMWGVASVSFSDVDIEVKATQVTADPTDNNAYGIGCRLQQEGYGYYLVISGDGGYAIILVTEDDEVNLVDWTATDAVNMGNASNNMRAVCDGTTLTLYANGKRLATAEDSTFDSGDIGLVAVTYENAPTEIHFDNIVVTKP